MSLVELHKIHSETFMQKLCSLKMRLSTEIRISDPSSAKRVVENEMRLLAGACDVRNSCSAMKRDRVQTKHFANSETRGIIGGPGKTRTGELWFTNCRVSGRKQR